jgi:hypothetical protein
MNGPSVNDPGLDRNDVVNLMRPWIQIPGQ